MFVCRCEVVWLIFTSLSFCFCDCGTSSFSSSSRGWRGLCGFFFSFSLNENLPRSTPPILSNLSVVCVVTFLELPRACLISSTSWSFSSSCLSLCSSSSRRWSISLSFSSISFLRCLSTSISRLFPSLATCFHLPVTAAAARRHPPRRRSTSTSQRSPSSTSSAADPLGSCTSLSSSSLVDVGVVWA